jgi:hypothetical protein
MSLASAFGQDGHDAVKTAFDDDIISLLEIDSAGVVLTAVASNETDPIDIDDDKIAVHRFQTYKSVHIYSRSLKPRR